MSTLGTKYKIEFSELVKNHELEIAQDSLNINAYLGLAESNILLYVSGYVPRTKAFENAKAAFSKAIKLDSLNSEVIKLSGILAFLDWKCRESKIAFLRAFKTNTDNLNARHWYVF